MLEAFFRAVNPKLIRQFSKKEGLLGSGMRVHGKTFPQLTGVRVGLLGLGENADLIRPHLYGYSHLFRDLEIADLGNLAHDGTEENLISGLRECLLALFEEGIIPIVIGENHQYSEALLKGVPFKSIDYSLISPEIAFHPESLAWKLKNKKRLFRASFLGIQNFMNTEASLQLSSEVFSETLRLGEIKQNAAICEPIFRQTDIIEFDLSSIRFSEFTSSKRPLPSGLNNREACAICRYAGISNSASLYLLNQFTLGAEKPVDCMQVAQMIWYLLDGIDNRFNDHPQINNRNFTVYKCHADSGEDMMFLYNEQSERWWIQIPEKDGSKKKKAPRYIGCSASDYEIAMSGEVPEIWYKAAYRA